MAEQKLKGKLKVQLFVNETLVAESEDPALWQAVLAAVTGSDKSEVQAALAIQKNASQEHAQVLGGRAIQAFAAQLRVTPEVLVGACDPRKDAPYIHLDEHCWEELKKNTPKRGRSAVSPVRLAGTLLVFWFKHAELGQPTLGHIKEVLETINVEGTNPRRSIRNCPWLRFRGSELLLNPAETSTAIALATSYCTKEHVANKEQEARE